MKAYTLIYHHGHFFDKATGNRIQLQNGGEFVVGGDEELFSIPDPPGYKKHNEEKRVVRHITLLGEQLNGNSRDLVKLLPGESKVYFRIGCYNKASSLKGDFFFEAKLHEDLYAYRLNGKVRLEDCYCETVCEMNNRIPYFESIFGKSLNDLYKNTRVHYFQNIGHSTVNAFDRFFTEPTLSETKVLRTLAEAAYSESSGSNLF